MGMTPKEKAGACVGKITTLWKSGKKGKCVIIVGALFLLGLVGSFIDDEEKQGGALGETKSAEVSKSGKSAKNGEESILEMKPEPEDYDVLNAKYSELGIDAGEKLLFCLGMKYGYAIEFKTPVTEDMAKVNPKNQLALFGGALKLGDEIDASSMTGKNGFYCIYNSDFKDLKDVVLVFSGPIPRQFKEFAGIEGVDTGLWLWPQDSDKATLFAVLTKGALMNFQMAKAAQEQISKLIKNKYPGIKDGWSGEDGIEDNLHISEYIYNGDMVKICRREEGLQATLWVSMIRPSIYAKLLNILNEDREKKLQEARKREKKLEEGF